MSPDYTKRGYLLPKGCKDLIDVIKLQGPANVHVPQPPGQPWVGGVMAVSELAALLGQKPFVIVADLMELGIFATVKQQVPLEVVCKVAKKYGCIVKTD